MIGRTVAQLHSSNWNSCFSMLWKCLVWRFDKVFSCIFVGRAVPRRVPDSAQSSRPGEEAADGLGPRGVHGLWLPPQGRHPRAAQRPGCGARHLQVSLREDVIVATCCGQWSGQGALTARCGGHALGTSSGLDYNNACASSSSGPWLHQSTAQCVKQILTKADDWILLGVSQQNRRITGITTVTLYIVDRTALLCDWCLCLLSRGLVFSCTAGCWRPAGSRFVLVHSLCKTTVQKFFYYYIVNIYTIYIYLLLYWHIKSIKQLYTPNALFYIVAQPTNQNSLRQKLIS